MRKGSPKRRPERGGMPKGRWTALVAVILVAAALAPVSGNTSPGDLSSVLQRWAARYDGPANAADYAVALAVSPDGGRIYVTGESEGGVTSLDYATVAYDAATARPLWVARYNGPGNLWDQAYAL